VNGEVHRRSTYLSTTRRSLYVGDAHGGCGQSRTLDHWDCFTEAKERSRQLQSRVTIQASSHVIGRALRCAVCVPMSVDIDMDRGANTGRESREAKDFESHSNGRRHRHSDAHRGRLPRLSRILRSQSRQSLIRALDLSLLKAQDAFGSGGKCAGTKLDGRDLSETAVPINDPGTTGRAASVDQDVLGSLHEDGDRDRSIQSNVGTHVKDTRDTEAKEGDGGHEIE